MSYITSSVPRLIINLVSIGKRYLSSPVYRWDEIYSLKNSTFEGTAEEGSSSISPATPVRGSLSAYPIDVSDIHLIDRSVLRLIVIIESFPFPHMKIFARVIMHCLNFIRISMYVCTYVTRADRRASATSFVPFTLIFISSLSDPVQWEPQQPQFCTSCGIILSDRLPSP